MLLAGHWRASLYYHPLLAPLLVLVLISVIVPIVHWFRNRCVLVGNWLLYAWVLTLSLAWAAKLMGPTGAW